MVKSNTLETLKEYLSTKHNINPEKVNRETSLLYDLELKGDDIDDFLGALIKDFNIEVKQLDVSRFYIGEEPFDFLSPLIRVFKGERASEKPTITIGDIEKFIQTGILE